MALFLQQAEHCIMKQKACCNVKEQIAVMQERSMAQKRKRERHSTKPEKECCGAKPLPQCK